jgi:hypothetical protein
MHNGQVLPVSLSMYFISKSSEHFSIWYVGCKSCQENLIFDHMSSI